MDIFHPPVWSICTVIRYEPSRGLYMVAVPHSLSVSYRAFVGSHILFIFVFVDQGYVAGRRTPISRPRVTTELQRGHKS